MKFDIMKYIGDFTSLTFKFFDNAYKEGWLWYLLGGVVVLLVLGLFF